MLIRGFAVFSRQAVLDRVRLREKSDRQCGRSIKALRVKTSRVDSRQTPLIAAGPTRVLIGLEAS